MAVKIQISGVSLIEDGVRKELLSEDDFLFLKGFAEQHLAVFEFARSGRIGEVAVSTQTQGDVRSEATHSTDATQAAPRDNTNEVRSAPNRDSAEVEKGEGSRTKGRSEIAEQIEAIIKSGKNQKSPGTPVYPFRAIDFIAMVLKERSAWQSLRVYLPYPELCLEALQLGMTTNSPDAPMAIRNVQSILRNNRDRGYFDAKPQGVSLIKIPEGGSPAARNDQLDLDASTESEIAEPDLRDVPDQEQGNGLKEPGYLPTPDDI